MSKYQICFFILINSNTAFAQLGDIKEIESLFKLYEKYSSVDKLKALNYAKQASILAEKANDSKYKTYSYIYMSRTLSLLRMQKESSYYFNKAVNEKHYKNDVLAKAMIKQIKANYCLFLKLNSTGLKENLGILELLKDEKSLEAARLKVRTLGNVAGYYRKLSKFNKALSYFKQAEFILNEPVFKNKNFSDERSKLYVQWGYYYLDLNQKDSALYFMKKSLDIAENHLVEFKHLSYKALADYYLAEQNYEEALSFYFLSIKDIESKNMDYGDNKLVMYKKIEYIYNKLNDSPNENLYQQKYNNESGKVIKFYNENIQKEVDLILSAESIDEVNTVKKNYVYRFGSMFVLILISLFILYKYLSIKKQKFLEEKSYQLYLKDQENNKLKQNLTPKLDNLKRMAIENNPLFFVKFQEVFPQFQNNLLKINSNLQKSELELLAYIFMNFETKEIAEYTFKSPKTIQNRKHQLRKKIGIPSSDDMYVWLKSNCS